MPLLIEMTPEQDAAAKRYFASADFWSASRALRQGREHGTFLFCSGAVFVCAAIFAVQQAGGFGIGSPINATQVIVGLVLGIGGALVAFAGAWLANAAEKDHAAKRLAYYREIGVEVVE